MSQTIMVPGSWYDLTARISAARACANAVMRAMPCNEAIFKEANEACNLAAACEMLLAQAEDDAHRLELDLKGV